MGCNKNAIRVRVNPWNINSTRTMYAQYYALEFNIILNLTSPIKVDVIWIICSYDFIIIYEKCFFWDFFNNFVSVYFQFGPPCSALLIASVSQLWGENSPILLNVKIPLTHLLIIPVDVPLNGFLSIIMSWSVFKN